jgi:hypothetical protein
MGRLLVPFSAYRQGSMFQMQQPASHILDECFVISGVLDF